MINKVTVFFFWYSCLVLVWPLDVHRDTVLPSLIHWHESYFILPGLNIGACRVGCFPQKSFLQVIFRFYLSGAFTSYFMIIRWHMGISAPRVVLNSRIDCELGALISSGTASNWASFCQLPLKRPWPENKDVFFECQRYDFFFRNKILSLENVTLYVLVV